MFEVKHNIVHDYGLGILSDFGIVGRIHCGKLGHLNQKLGAGV